MKKSIFTLIFTLFFTQLFATETQVIVRAKAKDAKFIGSSIGGAYVIIRNALTDAILAEGKTMGSTGNTNLIMTEAHERGKALTDDNTAKFLARIELDEPTFVRIEVMAPLNKKQARVNASTELWLIPGKHILGDGVILEIPGFIIDILAPRTHRFINLSKLENNTLKIEANMVMMCGCTISSGGLWDANKIEVKAMINVNGKPWKEIELKSQQANLVEADVQLTQTGTYEIIVYAYDAKTGNTGVDKVNVVVNE